MLLTIGQDATDSFAEYYGYTATKRCRKYLFRNWTTSAIGFSKSMTEEFDDLKKGQEALTTRVDGIKSWYTTLKKKEEEEEAKVKAAGENSEEEEGEDVLHLLIQTSQYCDAVQSWMTEAGQTIVIFPSKRLVDRKRRTVDFVNKMKVLLRKTKPIREDEGKEDAEWLGTWVSELPEEPAASAVALFDVGAEAASSLRRVLRNAKLAITGKKEPAANLIRHLTPESTAKERVEKLKREK